ncbi:MAG TPA: hypothetical protein PK440_08420 [Candidatus Accumulibacter phosphatis]|nr:hypothetical protein [Candidatus Accumulibacter phosphatis]HRQ95008.1 hypothetical protein [Candidatus Accumulibacter phosphatis]
MNSAPDNMREKLLLALSESDAMRRSERANRIEWLSLHSASYPMIMGRAETLRLIEEARGTFTDGHFVATLFVAMAFIEHALVEELQLKGRTKGSPLFSQAIDMAIEVKLFPPDWLQRAKALSLRRNSFAHLKESDHPHTLGARVMEEKAHPVAIMEADAQEAIDLMFNFFVATTREADLEAAFRE